LKLNNNKKKVYDVIDEKKRKMQRKSKEESCLLSIDTEHASYRNQGEFKINIGNSIFIEKALVAVPIKAVMTNIFPNVTKYNNTIEIGVSGPGTPSTITVPIGFYSLDELIVALNTATAVFFGAFVVWSKSTDNKIEITNTAGTSITVSGPTEFWDLIGVIHPISDADFAIDDIPNGQTAIADYLPALQGERVVHVECDKLSHGNLISSRDGKPHDILITIPLAETAYGFTKIFSPAASDMYSVQYKYTNSLSSTLDFRLLDSRLRVLDYPNNQHFHLLLKVHHNEHDGG